jgi:GT2 family glycosyltransferase
MTEPGAGPLVAVLIATRDRAADLARCLPTVLANGYPRFEVVIADQGTTDAARRVVDALGDARVRYFHDTRPGKSRALNRAAAVTDAELLALTDDDCTVPPGWIQRAVDVLARDADAALVAGAMLAVPHDWRTEFIPEFAPQGYCRLQGLRGRLRMPRGTAGGNMVVRAEVWRRLGGFDPVLGPGARFLGAEDGDFAYRALRAGLVVVEDPASAVQHWGARPVAGGAAAALRRGYAYSQAAHLTKLMRCRDAVAAVALARITARTAWGAARSLVRTGHPSGAGQVLSLVRGFAHGLRQPLDRRCEQYRAADEAR